MLKQNITMHLLFILLQSQYYIAIIFSRSLSYVPDIVEQVWIPHEKTNSPKNEIYYKIEDVQHLLAECT